MPKAKKITLTALDKKFSTALSALEHRFTILFQQMNQKMDAGFASTDAGFASIDARFASMDARFASMDAGFASTDAGFASVDARFASMDAQFGRLARLVVAIQSDVEDLKPLKSLPERVDSLHGMVEHLLVGSERLEQEYTMITAALRRLEESREIQ